jgi:hypothetical protein
VPPAASQHDGATEQAGPVPRAPRRLIRPPPPTPPFARREQQHLQSAPRTTRRSAGPFYSHQSSYLILIIKEFDTGKKKQLKRRIA